MKRSGFALRRIRPERSQDEKNAWMRKALEACAGAVPRVMDCGTTTGPRQKEAIKAKPGKGGATVEEKAWMDWIRAYGCIACRLDGAGYVPAVVHHILRGGRRIGHLHTIPLCDPGHHQLDSSSGKIPRHPFKARFEARYGTEQELLERLQTIRNLEGSP